MGIQTFDPSEREIELALQAIRPGEEDQASAISLFVADIQDADRVLPQLAATGQVLITFENYPAFWILRNSPYSEQIAWKMDYDNDVAVFQPVTASIPQRRNPDDDDFIITAADIEPDETFYENIIGRYSDWQKAWWREVLQNSVDTCLEAMAREGRRGLIKCEVHQYEGDNRVMVRVEDNGMGMSKDILRRAFLTPGGSAKRGTSATGGLGKAKEMLYHAWPMWSVHTQQSGSRGLYVRARYDPSRTGNLLESKSQNRGTPGTTVTVDMKQDKCVSKQDLMHFIQLSEFPITVKYREITHFSNGTEEITDEETVKADNTILDREPIRVLTRPDGSPWARIYHSPRSRKQKGVIIRANGLFLFEARGEYDVPGKVVVELDYKPRGGIWDNESEEWSINEILADQQNIDQYGPIEMLVESRDALNWRYDSRLQNFLNDLAARGKSALKKEKRSRKKTYKRVGNRKARKFSLDDVMELITPEQLMDKTDEALGEMQRTMVKEVLKKLKERLDSDADFAQRPTRGRMEEVFTASELVMLEEEIKKDPDLLLKLLTGGTETRGSGGTSSEYPRCSECGYEMDPETNRIWKSRVAGEYLDCPGCGAEDAFRFVERKPETARETAKAVQEAVDEAVKAQVSINTGLDDDLFEIYRKYLPRITKEARDQGRDRYFGENIARMLSWQPDFLLIDETDFGTPTVPDKFHPENFSNKEKIIAKLWVEFLRLAHILKGRSIPDLDVGFIFEDPDENAAEALAQFRKENQEGIGQFSAILLAPAVVTASGNWAHAYKATNSQDIAKILAYSVHEIVHAIMDQSGEPSGHNTTFANIITDDMATVLDNVDMFMAIAKHVKETYKTARVPGQKKARVPGQKKAPAKAKLDPGMTYYKLKQQGRRGPPRVFVTLDEVREYFRDNPDNYDLKGTVYTADGDKIDMFVAKITEKGTVWKDTSHRSFNIEDITALQFSEQDWSEANYTYGIDPSKYFRRNPRRRW